MTIEAQDLRNAIATGIKSMGYRSIQLIGNRGDDPRPEYLTTASICFSLCDFAERRPPSQEIHIRAEEMTSAVWAKTNVLQLLKRRGQGARAQRRSKKRAAIRQRNSTRNGNVDITLFEGAGFEQPFAVVENKGMLTFTKLGELGAGSKSEVEKDIKRNFEFVLRNGAQGGVQYGAFTFYLRDADSTLTAQGKAYCKEKREYFEKYLQTLDLHPDVRINVLVDTLDANLYETDADARVKDFEDGPEAHDMDPAWHLVYGVISLYRIGASISDSSNLFSESSRVT